MKTLWIVSGGLEAVPGIMRAKAMGLHVVVSDGNSRAPGAAIADDFVLASTYNISATVSAAADYQRTVRPLDGVICMAADVPITVASVAAELGLPGIPVEAARLSSDKLAMKQRFAAAGIPIPWFCRIESGDHLLKMSRERGFPLVIKPVDSRGARGVLKLNPEIDLNWSYRHAREHSPSGKVILEEYLDGPQISTESVLIEGRGFTPGFTDRNYEYLDHFAPNLIENGGQQPSSLSDEEQRDVKRYAENAGVAMGIQTGIAKGDMVLTKEGPKVIEIAARLSGGWFSSDQIPLATGVDLIGAAIKLALGENVAPEELKPRFQKGVAIRYFFPDKGRIVAIRGVEKALEIAGVHKIDFFMNKGDVVEPVTNHTKRVGYVITVGESREEAVETAEKAVNTITFEVVRDV